MFLSNVLSFLETSASINPDKTALKFGKTKITYQELLTASKRIAGFLVAHYKKEKPVALMMENSPDWLTAYFGIMAAGMSCVPLNLRSADESLVSQVLFTDAQLVIVSEKFLSRWKKLIKKFKVPPVVFTLTELQAKSGKKPDFSSNPAKFPTILFTSGTTSVQKAIRLSQQTVVAATRNIIDYLKLDCDDVYYATLPFYHSFGLGNVHTVLAMGGTIVISDAGTDLKKDLQNIARYRATFWAATPYTLEMAIRHFLNDFIKAGKYLRKLCTNTGPMPSAVTKTIIERLPRVQFFTYYGLTEASRSTFMHYNLYPDKLESVGCPAPNVAIRIDDNKNKILPSTQIGEVCVSGPHVVNEYFKNNQLSKERFKDGWLYTGDLGYFDQDGFLYVVGRRGEVVDIDGEKFSLEVVDKTLNREGVIDSASYTFVQKGLTVIAGCVVTKKGQDWEVLKTKLFEDCRTKLDRHAVPRKIISVDYIPRTDNGKIKRNLLREKYDK